MTLPELTMVLSSDDAARRLCPLSMANPEGPQPCRASECMAWRWRSIRDADGFRNTQHDANFATGYCSVGNDRPHESH
jgi:hypothetical protein